MLAPIKSGIGVNFGVDKTWRVVVTLVAASFSCCIVRVVRGAWRRSISVRPRACDPDLRVSVRRVWPW